MNGSLLSKLIHFAKVTRSGSYELDTAAENDKLLQGGGLWIEVYSSQINRLNQCDT